MDVAPLGVNASGEVVVTESSTTDFVDLGYLGLETFTTFNQFRTPGSYKYAITQTAESPLHHGNEQQNFSGHGKRVSGWLFVSIGQGSGSEDESTGQVRIEAGDTLSRYRGLDSGPKEWKKNGFSLIHQAQGGPTYTNEPNGDARVIIENPNGSSLKQVLQVNGSASITGGLSIGKNYQ
jgi:hypothetical protein